jgi:hypothetical protein
LREGERFVAHYPANRSQGKRAVGGGLHVTTQRLLFHPNRIDAGLGGKAWSCAVADVVGVGVEPGRPFSLFEMFSGGTRDRLRLDLRDGTCALFAMRAPGIRAEELRQLISAGDTDALVPRAELPGMRIVER